MGCQLNLEQQVQCYDVSEVHQLVAGGGYRDRHASTHENVLCTFLKMELTPRSRILLEKLIFTQLFKKFPSFYGTRRFTIMSTTAPLASIQSQVNPGQSLTLYSLNDFNITLPSTPKSALHIFRLTFRVYFLCLVRATCPTYLIHPEH
jgi:hypothetical protein